VAGGAEQYIPRVALKGAVVLQFKASESLPAHEVLGKLERAVLHQLAIEAAVGGVVDVLEEDAIHGRLYGGTRPAGVDVKHILRLSHHSHDDPGRNGQ